MRRIIFVAAHLAQPRVIRRIKAIKNAGFDIKVYGYDTGLYSDNISDYGDIPLTLLSCTKGKSRLKRTLNNIIDIRKISKEMRNGSMLYVFGLPLGIAVRYFTRVRDYIYEEADMMPTGTTKIDHFFLKELDKTIIKKSYATVFTSQGFSDFLFGNRQPDNVIIIPNKLNPDILNSARPHNLNISDKNIKFGFIGAIRFSNTVLRFARVVGQSFPQHQFHFYGDGPSRKEVELIVQQYNNIFYHGPFQSPQDLARIYSMIDINVVCYDASVLGVRLSEPNKLYESLYFGKPIIASENSFFGKKVLDLGVGFAINAAVDSEIEHFIKHITVKQLQICIKKSMNIPSNELIDNLNLLINFLKEKK
jgi:succinoglycan biosynthesis protein ExoL